MKRGKWGVAEVVVAVVLVMVVALWAMPRVSESACGASATSCKNCHEVKGEKKVNDSGDHHTQHAFGDFCVFCHSGNTAATGKDEAHQGMVKPLESLDKSCAACHPDDFEDRAKKYKKDEPKQDEAKKVEDK
jgi:hypothetical protein